tara:strand:- start:1357 stop:2178 length:822 start_codon:yes stop_codon:yes gene_type:complete
MTFQSPDARLLEQLIGLARRTSREIIMPSFRSPNLSISAKSSPHDLVTAADETSETFLTEEIRRLYPTAKILGEETASADPAILTDIDTAEICFVIDPIDGTWNYAHGIATFGVAIAVLRHGKPVMGILHDPAFDDTIWAIQRGGAFLRRPNGQERQLSASAGRAGFINIPALDATKAGAAIEVGHKFSAIKSLGCSCHEYRLLAQGLLSWGLATQSKPWDHAAGMLIHQEAGGVTRFIDGAPYSVTRTDCAILSASDQSTWEQLAAGLAPLV